MTNVSYALPSDAPTFQMDGLTPLQHSIANIFDQRARQNLKVPDITFQSQFTGNINFAAGEDTEPFTMTSTTTIHFDGPEQAGFIKWPAFVVPNGFATGDEARLIYVDRTEEFRSALEHQVPELLNQYGFGYEPRTLQITESLVHVPGSSVAMPLSAGHASTNESILLGFNYELPTSQYSIHIGLTVLGVQADLVIGYELSGALGLRLPAEITLSGPLSVGEWGDYSLNAYLKPLNWNAAQYINAGAAGEAGNEFVDRFTAIVYVDVTLPIFGTTTFERGINFNKGKSFQTPVGAHAAFPVLSIDNINLTSITVFGFINVNFGVRLDFNVSSSDIKANWQVLTPDNASGQGAISFSRPNTAVNLGIIRVDDMPPDNIDVELRDFQYLFDYFRIDVYLNVWISLGPIKSPKWPILLGSIDLSQIFGGLELSAKDYVECSWDFICSRTGPDNVAHIITPINIIDAAPVRNYNTVDSIILTWNRISWASGYQVQIADNSDFKGSQPVNVGLTLNYLTPSLTIGRYYWRVRPQRANGTWGAWSPVDYFVIDLD